MYHPYNPWMNPIEGYEQEYGIPNNVELARAYVPRQPYVGLFPLKEALRKGTLFPNLYIPYPIKSLE